MIGKVGLARFLIFKVVRAEASFLTSRYSSIHEFFMRNPCLCDFAMPEALPIVIVDHPHGLHE